MDAPELNTWRRLWLEYGFGERREDLRWARLCLIATSNPDAMLDDYLDWIDHNADALQERQQKQIELNLAMSIGMNNREFQEQEASGT